MTATTTLTALNARAIVQRIREECSKAFALPLEWPFFMFDYHPSEDPDAALLRLFRAEQAASGSSEINVIRALVYG